MQLHCTSDDWTKPPVSVSLFRFCSNTLLQPKIYLPFFFFLYWTNKIPFLFSLLTAAHRYISTSFHEPLDDGRSPRSIFRALLRVQRHQLNPTCQVLPSPVYPKPPVPQPCRCWCWVINAIRCTFWLWVNVGFQTLQVTITFHLHAVFFFRVWLHDLLNTHISVLMVGTGSDDIQCNSNSSCAMWLKSTCVF